MTTNMQKTQDYAMPAHETGCQSAKQHEQPACKTINMHTGMGAMQEGAKEARRPPARPACQARSQEFGTSPQAKKK